jgi:hypothetical protein
MRTKSQQEKESVRPIPGGHQEDAGRYRSHLLTYNKTCLRLLILEVIY